MGIRDLLLALGLGLVATLVTGLVSNTPARLVGATHYGFPFAWLVQLIVAPQYFPWQVDFPNLAIDVAVWSLVAWAFIFFISRPRK